MERCKTCKHWVLETHDGWGVALEEAGECTKARQIWDVTEVKEPENGADYRVLLPEHAAILAVVEDGSGYSARLVTMPDFGCVQHEPKLDRPAR